MTDAKNDSRFEIFKPEDRAFLAEIFARRPKIGENFARYLSLPMDERPFQMMEDLRDLHRAGWVKRGIPNPESVLEHSAYVLRYSFREAPEGVDRFHAAKLAVVHDNPEVLITDFTPGDKITAAEKEHLERLAIEVLTDKEDVRAHMIEFIEQKTPEAQWVHDVDKLDPAFVALQYEARYPEKMGIFKEFLAYTKPILKTGKGKKMLTELEQDADAVRGSYRTQFAQKQDRLTAMQQILNGYTPLPSGIRK